MTATDELCRLLDEADIEYKVTSCHLCSSTEWECDLGNAVFYEVHTNGYTRVTIHYKDGMTHFQITSNLKPPERYVTPEQAIAATVGRGTCHLRPWEMERDTGFYDCMECDCGYVADVGDWAEWHFCPNCGRKVVDE